MPWFRVMICWWRGGKLRRVMLVVSDAERMAQGNLLMRSAAYEVRAAFDKIAATYGGKVGMKVEFFAEAKSERMPSRLSISIAASTPSRSPARRACSPAIPRARRRR